MLLESDNHECPECHETDVSPDTLIPNRYLRRAVMNFKNQTGYTRVKKSSFVKCEPMVVGRESPQPSPDSTVESQPQQADANVNQSDKPVLAADKNKPTDAPPVTEDHGEKPTEVCETSQSRTSPKPSLDEE